MLEQAITTLNTAIEPLNYFETQFELVEIVTDGEKSYPAHYLTKGEYKEINIDKDNGVSYWRKPSQVVMSQGETLIACKDVIEFNYPLRLIGAIPKEKLSADDAYSEERVIQTILSVITGSNKAIKTAIGANAVFIQPSSHDDDALRILPSEYSNVVSINYSFAYFRIDIDLLIQIREDCIPNECD